jgi:hypothetical protein
MSYFGTVPAWRSVRIAGSGMSMKAFGFRSFAALVAVMMMVLPITASATTMTFSFVGSHSLDGCCSVASGNGSFSFSPTSGAVMLSDLASFNVTWIANGSTSFTAGLGDLSSFSLSSGTLSNATISFQTNFVANDPYLPQSFGVTGTLSDANGLVAFENLNDGGGTVQVADGPVTFTQMPEPLTISLFGAGLVGAAAMGRRKKKSA